MEHLKLFALLLPLIISFSASAEIYKYQDAQGRWHFSDKKPAESNSTETLDLSHAHTSKQHIQIALSREVQGDQTSFFLRNPYVAPIQCFVDAPNGQKLNILVEADETSEVVSGLDLWTRETDFDYWCIFGHPDTEPDGAVYYVPFSGYKSLEISQGFNGRFSHFEEPHVYAIDIAMPVGTPISAARGGTVISTRDDYAYAGVSSAFFFDKANYVQVLHEDGTYATYGHLLIGKILVQPGDAVEAGQIIGYSGNTGFSTGPHLHFVIQYNHKGVEKSVPFKLEQSNGETITPGRGLWLLPSGR